MLGELIAGKVGVLHNMIVAKEAESKVLKSALDMIKNYTYRFDKRDDPGISVFFVTR